MELENLDIQRINEKTSTTLQMKNCTVEFNFTITKFYKNSQTSQAFLSTTEHFDIFDQGNKFDLFDVCWISHVYPVCNKIVKSSK